MTLVPQAAQNDLEIGASKFVIQALMATVQLSASLYKQLVEKLKLAETRFFYKKTPTIFFVHMQQADGCPMAAWLTWIAIALQTKNGCISV